MKLIVGLGNPGRRYARTRHNVGFRIVERFGERCGLAFDRERFDGRFARGRVKDEEVALLEPLTYMNRSGGSVVEALRYLPLDDVSKDLLLVSDDTDLPFGRLRIRAGGGPGGHKGLEDVIECLGRRDFARLRFGVGRPPAGFDTADYVLQRFGADEESELDARVDDAARAGEVIVIDGVDAAMNRFNRAPEREEMDDS